MRLIVKKPLSSRAWYEKIKNSRFPSPYAPLPKNEIQMPENPYASVPSQPAPPEYGSLGAGYEQASYSPQPPQTPNGYEAPEPINPEAQIPAPAFMPPHASEHQSDIGAVTTYFPEDADMSEVSDALNQYYGVEHASTPDAGQEAVEPSAEIKSPGNPDAGGFAEPALEERLGPMELRPGPDIGPQGLNPQPIDPGPGFGPMDDHV